MAEQGEKISGLPAASTLDGSELIPGVQNGQTKKATVSQIAALVKSSLSKSDVGLGNVDNVRQYSATNPPPSELPAVTASDNGKVLGVVSGGWSKMDAPSGGGVTSVAGKTGAVTLVPSDVGLGNVDNVRQYSASNPPPTPSAADVGAVPTGRTVNGKPLSSNVTLNASDIPYDNTNSGILAIDVQGALDEIAQGGGGGGSGTTVIANPSGAATDTLNKLQVGQTIYDTSSGGTEVVANPSGTSTDTLTKLQVGQTIYGIPGGSSVDFLTVVNGEICVVYEVT